MRSNRCGNPPLGEVRQRGERKRLERPRWLTCPDYVGKAKQLQQRRAGVHVSSINRWFAKRARHALRADQEPMLRPARAGSRDLYSRPCSSTRADHRLRIEWPLRPARRRSENLLCQNIEASKRARPRTVCRVQRLANLKSPPTTGYHVGHTH